MPPSTRAITPKTMRSVPMSFTAASASSQCMERSTAQRQRPGCSRVIDRSSFKEYPMKYVSFVSGAGLLLLVATVSAHPAGGQMQGQKIGLATSLQRSYAGFKTNFTAAAEKMPDADYSFKPGSTPEARTFAAAIAHIVQAQF